MRGWLRGLAALAILVALWAAVAEVARSPLAPGPVEVARVLLGALRDGTLPRAVVTTVARLLVGYSIALAVGVPLGCGLARSRFLKQSVGPIVLGLGSVPSICWLPLAILWFGLSEWAIQLVVVLGAALPVAVATENAVRHVPPSNRARGTHDGGAWGASHADGHAACGSPGDPGGSEGRLDVRPALAHGR